MSDNIGKEIVFCAHKVRSDTCVDCLQWKVLKLRSAIEDSLPYLVTNPSWVRWTLLNAMKETE